MLYFAYGALGDEIQVKYFGQNTVLLCIFFALCHDMLCQVASLLVMVGLITLLQV